MFLELDWSRFSITVPSGEVSPRAKYYSRCLRQDQHSTVSRWLPYWLGMLDSSISCPAAWITEVRFRKSAILSWTCIELLIRDLRAMLTYIMQGFSSSNSNQVSMFSKWFLKFTRLQCSHDCDADQESTGTRLQIAALIRLDLYFILMSAIFTWALIEIMFFCQAYILLTMPRKYKPCLKTVTMTGHQATPTGWPICFFLQIRISSW
jgi:hypothetical protein